MAVNSIGDTLLLIRNKILSISSVTDLVEDRVLTDHFYDFDDATIQMPLIVLDLQTGEANPGMGVQRLELDIYCYSKTSSAQSVLVYDKLYENLNAERLYRSELNPKGILYEFKRPDTGYNKEIRAWYALGKYIINTTG